MSMAPQMLIYVKELNNRVHYIFRHVLNRMMGIRPTFTNDKEAFINCVTPKLNYSYERFGDEFYIKPDGLLYEKGLKRISLQVVKYNELPVLFSAGDTSDFGFDIFSAIFYLLTRYEEHLPYSPDRFDRYQAHESLAYNSKFLEEPIVEQWVQTFKDFLKSKFPDYESSDCSYQYLPTIDVDIAFAYKHRGIFMGTGLFIRDLFKGHFLEIFRRLKVLFHLMPDPYDNFDFLKTSFENSGIRPVFFFPSGKRGKFDRNISLSKSSMRKILFQTSNYADIGLHPSYISNKSSVILEKEKETLETTIELPVIKNRQHFVKLYFPRTYQNLLKIGITEEYSMGYSTAIGFRSGTCTPYNFYDLSREKETELKIYPFQIMDFTMKEYLKLAPNEAEKKINEIKDKIKKVNGLFIMVWHNDTFAPTPEGMEWRRIFTNLLQE
jgi:hypothetical protein